MKIVVLGGAADMAIPSIKYLLKATEVRNVILADINLKKIESLASELGSKVSARVVNVRSEDDVRNIAKDADLVMNFIGPYYRFGTKALETIIDSGTDYIDICDDYDVTMEALDLSEKAKEKGVTALIGMGASPGITNVLARLASDALDEVAEINTYWTVGDAEPSGYGALMHFFHCIEGEIPTYENGRFRYIRPFQKENARTVDFGKPVGPVTLYHIGHPEPVTLSTFIPGVQTVTNFGALIPSDLNGLFKTFVDAGLTSETPIDFKGDDVVPLEFLLTLLQHNQENESSKLDRLEQSIGASRIEVIGVKAGKEVVYTFTSAGYHTMADSTSIPTGVAALLMLQGKIMTKGVIPPECIDPKKILLPLKETGFFGQKDTYQLVRKMGEETVTSSLFNKNDFPEFW